MTDIAKHLNSRDRTRFYMLSDIPRRQRTEEEAEELAELEAKAEAVAAKEASRNHKRFVRGNV